MGKPVLHTFLIKQIFYYTNDYIKGLDIRQCLCKSSSQGPKLQQVLNENLDIYIEIQWNIYQLK